MFTIDAEEKARAKYLVDRLAPLRGFIAEEAEKKMLLLYPQKMIRMVRRYCQSGQEMLLVADRVEGVFDEISEAGLEDADMINRTLHTDFDFPDWFMEQNVIAETEWLNEGCERKDKYPECLSALEQKILDLYIEKNMKLAQLAEEMACKAHDEYVVLVLHYVKKKLASADCVIKELEERLESEKLELDW